MAEFPRSFGYASGSRYERQCPTPLQRDGLKFKGEKGIVLLSTSEILLAVPEPGRPPLLSSHHILYLHTGSPNFRARSAFGCQAGGHACPWVRATCNFCVSTKVALGSAEGLQLKSVESCAIAAPAQVACGLWGRRGSLKTVASGTSMV